MAHFDISSLFPMTNTKQANVRGMCSTIAFTVAMLCGHDVHARAWPNVMLPAHLVTFEIAENITLNAMPMQLKGFVSSLKPAKLADDFRISLKQPLIENRLGNTLILGREQGEHYLLVQIEPAGDGSRGIMALTDMNAAPHAVASLHLSRDRWLSFMPTGTRLISLMTSQDNNKISHHLVFANHHDPHLNHAYIRKAMTEEGLMLEHVTGSNNLATIQPSVYMDSKMLFFKGKGNGKDAIATVSRDSTGQVVTVLNIVTRMEHYQ